MTIAYLNGTFAPLKELSLPLTDRGFLFGDGIFTTLRVYNGEIEYWEPHLQRLKMQLQALEITPPTIDKEIAKTLIKKNDAYEGIWKLKIVITAGMPFGEKPRNYATVAVLLSPYTPPTTPSTVTVFPYPVSSPLAKFKTLSYLDRFYIEHYAKQHGYDDAIVTNAEGVILELAFSNLFWKRQKALYTPSRKLPLLEGIFLKNFLKGERKKGVIVHEVETPLKELPKDAELFGCNSLRGVFPVHFRNSISTS